MIKTSLLKELGHKVSVKAVTDNLKDCHLHTFCEALVREGMDIAYDKKYVYAKSERGLYRIADKLHNREWMKKIARHRVYEDCVKCKYLDEEEHLGKCWCDKWDTDIWNVSTPFEEDDHTINKGCVPFRYFGYSTPDDNRTQTQYRLKNVAMKTLKGKGTIEAFVETYGLKDVGEYFEDGNVFVGQFDEGARFGIRNNEKENTIDLQIKTATQHFESSFPNTLSAIYSLSGRWKETWNNEIEKKAEEQESYYGVYTDTADWSAFLGIGKTEEEAKEDAMSYHRDVTDWDDEKIKNEIEDLGVISITKDVYDYVNERGGEVSLEKNEQGIYDLYRNVEKESKLNKKAEDNIKGQLEQFIGKTLEYGSPGYPMEFILREVSESDKGLELVGDIPSATIGVEGHFFILTPKNAEEFIETGETFWQDDLGMQELRTQEKIEAKLDSKKKAGTDQHGKAPRQERTYDWINPEEYKKKHNKQDTKQFETSPSNTGEKYPTGINNSFSESDRDVGNLI